MSCNNRLAASLGLAALLGVSFATRAMEGTASGEPSPLCSAEGAFGIRIGDRGIRGTAPVPSTLFDRGCHQIRPPAPHPSFDTYAACVSEFDGQVYQIQAARVFDDQPPKGLQSLTAAQVKSNRQLGQQVLDDLLKQLPESLSSLAKVSAASRSWSVEAVQGVTLEVSNVMGWAVTFECRNEAMAMKVFRQRLQGIRQP